MPPGELPFPSLSELADRVARGEVSLTQARSLVEHQSVELLTPWMAAAREALSRAVGWSNSDTAFSKAFLELGLDAALRLQSAVLFLNFALNLGHLLCTEFDEVPRGLQLMEQGLQQLRVVHLPPEEVATVILAVSDAYVMFHKRMGAEHLAVAKQGYQTCVQMLGPDSPHLVLRARAHSGLGLCLAEEWVNGRMVHAAEAIQHYEQALRLLDPLADASLCGLVTHNLANAHQYCLEGDRSSHLQKALECFETALSIREKLNDKERLRVTCVTLGDLEAELGHTMRAVAHYERALESLNPIHERDEYARLLVSLAAICRDGSDRRRLDEDSLRSLAISYSVAARESTDPKRDGDTWAAAAAGLASLRYKARRTDDALALQEEILAKLGPSHIQRRARVSLDYLQMLAEKIASEAKAPSKNDKKVVLERVRQLREWIQCGDMEPYLQLFADSVVARANSLLTASDKEREDWKCKEQNFLHAALDNRPANARSNFLEVMQDRLLALAGSENPEAILIARSRVRQEIDFLKARPTLMECFDYAATQRTQWNVIIDAELNADQIDEAWRDSDRARARTLDLLVEAHRRRTKTGEDESYLPTEIQATHARLVAQWQASTGGSIEDGQRRDAIAPWLRESILRATQWRGQWVTETILPTGDDTWPLDIQDARTAIVEFYVSDKNSCAFVKIPEQPIPHVVRLPGLSVQHQLDWMGRWFHGYGEFEKRGPVAIREWAAEMDRVTLELGAECWEPMENLLESNHIQRVVFIPDLALDNFPLHAMALPSSAGEPQFFCDRYDVAVCPSLRQLHRARQRRGPVGPYALFLGNPQASCPTAGCIGKCRMALPVAEVELAALRENWPHVSHLTGQDCTPRAVLRSVSERRPDLLHASTHGVVRFEDPLGSGLVLSCDDRASEDALTVYVRHELTVVWGSEVSGEVLTLDAILRRVSLDGCGLAVLNACEVGLSHPGHPAEGLSLSAGFLAAGVPSVIAPLWPISESVAGLLTKRFYSELREKPQDKLGALMRAQRWVRTLRCEDLRGLVTPNQLAAGVSLSGPLRPFSHIFFWAPFQFSGSPD